MGLFSRSEPASGPGSRSRSSMSSEAQAAELRGRARRRLIGALALVLAAVIVVPALFDDPSVSDIPLESLVVVPAPVPATPNPEASGVVASNTTDSDIPMAELGESVASTVQDKPADTLASLPPEEPAAPVITEPTPAARPEAKPETKPAEIAPKPVAKPAAERTDDGSVAIALLEGRSPGKPAAAVAASGSFTLQIAAYTTDKDAQSRRDKLVSAGVTNAYVENARVNDKSTYRLRVGPFPSRDAAQAAQARLRALGYDNSFISAK